MDAMRIMRIMRAMRVCVEMHGAHGRPSGKDAEKPTPPSQALRMLAPE
jgi:hypothetical protein